MWICRNGEEFELTDDELFSAYCEQQERFDRMDVEEFTINNYNGKEFKEFFGVTKKEFRSMLDTVRYVYRRDFCTFDVCEAVHNAAEFVIQCQKAQHKLCEN